MDLNNKVFSFVKEGLGSCLVVSCLVGGGGESNSLILFGASS